MKRIDVLHCISQRQADVFQEICGPLPNIRVLPLVPPTIERLTQGPRFHDGNKSISFVALNINGSYKGSKLLENVFKSLAATTATYELHVYGSPFVEPEIRSVFYHGRYQSSDLDRIAESADFCIVPSVCDETLGFVGLEMMARGVPLVVSSRAGVCEYVEHGRTGLVFDPANEAEFLALLTNLISKPEQRRFYRAQLASQDAPLKTFAQHVTEMGQFFEDLIVLRSCSAAAP